jgi:hypothetical protein
MNSVIHICLKNIIGYPIWLAGRTSSGKKMLKLVKVNFAVGFSVTYLLLFAAEARQNCLLILHVGGWAAHSYHIARPSVIDHTNLGPKNSHVTLVSVEGLRFLFVIFTLFLLRVALKFLTNDGALSNFSESRHGRGYKLS